MDEDAERDVRQFDLMLDRLNQFRCGELTIGPLINDLKAVHYELQSVDEDWRDRFRDAWSSLEIPYAVALDRGERIPTITDATVAEGVAEIERLVTEARAAVTD